MGIFSAALRFSEVWYFIPTALCSCSRVSFENKDLILLHETRSDNFDKCWIGLCIDCCARPYSSWLFSLVYGEGFAGADGVLRFTALLSSLV